MYMYIQFYDSHDENMHTQVSVMCTLNLALYAFLSGCFTLHCIAYSHRYLHVYVDNSMASPLPATHSASLFLWALYDIHTYIAYSSPSCSYLMAFTKVRDCAAIHCHDGTAATILVSKHRLQLQALTCFTSTGWSYPQCAHM